MKSITHLLVLVTLAGCQQSSSTGKQTAVPLNDQLEQTASVAAATRYLKSRCNRSDLPDEQLIQSVAYRSATQKGWQSLSREAVRKESDAIYERLIRDSTPEEIKCGEFNRQLVPFIGELQAASRR